MVVPRWYRCLDAACEVVHVMEQAKLDPRWKVHRIPVDDHLEVRRDGTTVFIVPKLPGVRVFPYDGQLRMDTAHAFDPDAIRHDGAPRFQFAQSWWEPLLSLSLSKLTWEAVSAALTLPTPSTATAYQPASLGVTRKEARAVEDVVAALCKEAEGGPRERITSIELAMLRSNIQSTVR